MLGGEGGISCIVRRWSGRRNNCLAEDTKKQERCNEARDDVNMWSVNE